MINGTKGRDGAIDSLKIILSCFVVGLHGAFLYDFGAFFPFLLRNGVFRLAVPTFFVINGFYFERIGSRNLFKWFWHIITIYVIWTAIYAILWIPEARGSFRVILIDVFIGYYHLWYLPALAFAGVMLFFLRQQRALVIFFLALILFIIGCFFEYSGIFGFFGDSSIGDLAHKMTLHRNFLVFGFPFLAIGFLISRHEGAFKRYKCWFFPAAIIAVASVLAESALNYHIMPSPSEDLDLMVSLFPACALLFLWVRELQISGNSRLLSQVATAIYLVHVFVLKSLTGLMSLTPRVLVTLMISMVLSVLIIRLNRVVPLL